VIKWGTPHSITSVLRKYLTESQGQFSQTRQMRTAATTYRGTSLEVLQGAGSGSTHFVRCIRINLTGQPRDFQHEVVRQQLRALAVLNTAHARQKGYPHRIPFPEFIRRYGKKKHSQMLWCIIGLQRTGCTYHDVLSTSEVIWSLIMKRDDHVQWTLKDWRESGCGLFEGSCIL
jgi:hypothetical protein